jgi:hypothetical protein
MWGATVLDCTKLQFYEMSQMTWDLNTLWRGLCSVEGIFTLEVLSWNVGLLKSMERELATYNLKWMGMQVRWDEVAIESAEELVYTFV